jgi:hypothetical protein
VLSDARRLLTQDIRDRPIIGSGFAQSRPERMPQALRGQANADQAFPLKFLLESSEGCFESGFRPRNATGIDRNLERIALRSGSDGTPKYRMNWKGDHNSPFRRPNPSSRIGAKMSIRRVLNQ